mmetsp:Transcript_15476/g.43335  ORF Transcript_15476/g.43335 Transcript_15476/m.43335 type:complete len:251 (-) Transcript_15476:1208-1960(-)
MVRVHEESPKAGKHHGRCVPVSVNQPVEGEHHGDGPGELLGRKDLDQVGIQQLLQVGRQLPLPPLELSNECVGHVTVDERVQRPQDEVGGIRKRVAPLVELCPGRHGELKQACDKHQVIVVGWQLEGLDATLQLLQHKGEKEVERGRVAQHQPSLPEHAARLVAGGMAQPSGALGIPTAVLVIPTARRLALAFPILLPNSVIQLEKSMQLPQPLLVQEVIPQTGVDDPRKLVALLRAAKLDSLLVMQCHQ